MRSYLPFCRKDRIRKRESRQRRAPPRVNHDQVFLGEGHSNSPTSPNSNWFLKEKPPEEMRSTPTLTRAGGYEPFVVGRSLTRYSKELNRSDYRPSSANRYVRSHNDSDWRRGSMPVLPTSRLEVPNMAEERMVRLGMIPARSQEAIGHYPMGYMTAPHPRAKTRTKDKSRKSKELEDGRRRSGDVLMPVGEVQLWHMEDTMNPPPFPLPKEDYNTEGATWYHSRSLDRQSLGSSTSSYNYPRHGPQVYTSQNGRRISSTASPGHVSPTPPDTILEEYDEVETPEKLKRIHRVGVPILPD